MTCETDETIFTGYTSFEIAPKNISGMTVTLSATELEYTGSAQNVTVTGVTGLAVSDYDVSGATSGTTVNNYTVTGVMDDANAGTGKTVNVTVVLTNTNYSLATATTTTTVDIAKASAQTLTRVTLWRL